MRLGSRKAGDGPRSPAWRRGRSGWSILGQVLIFAVLAARPTDGAGITAFAQIASPGIRSGSGFAFAVPLLTEIISLEGEYARSPEGDTSPSLTLASGSLVLVAPFELIRVRPYFVTGFGIFRQKKDFDTETSMATMEGFGLFLRLGGPLHGRFDYRILQLQGTPLQEKQKRMYAGLTLRF